MTIYLLFPKKITMTSNSETWIMGKEYRFEASHQLPNHDGKFAILYQLPKVMLTSAILQ